MPCIMALWPNPFKPSKNAIPAAYVAKKSDGRAAGRVIKQQLVSGSKRRARAVEIFLFCRLLNHALKPVSPQKRHRDRKVRRS